MFWIFKVELYIVPQIVSCIHMYELYILDNFCVHISKIGLG